MSGKRQNPCETTKHTRSTDQTSDVLEILRRWISGNRADLARQLRASTDAQTNGPFSRNGLDQQPVETIGRQTIAGSDSENMVEPGGIEPPTSCMPFSFGLNVNEPGRTAENQQRKYFC